MRTREARQGREGHNESDDRQRFQTLDQDDGFYEIRIQERTWRRAHRTAAPCSKTINKP